MVTEKLRAKNPARMDFFERFIFADRMEDFAEIFGIGYVLLRKPSTLTLEEKFAAFKVIDKWLRRRQEERCHWGGGKWRWYYKLEAQHKKVMADARAKKCKCGGEK